MLAVVAAVTAWKRPRPEPPAPIVATRALTAAEVAKEALSIYPYDDILTADSDNLVLLRRPYLLYLRGDSYGPAAAEFAAIARRRPDIPEARLLQGISLVLAGSAEEAIPVLQEVRAKHPGYAPARWYLGQALFAVGRTEEALFVMRSVRDSGGEFAAQAARVLAAGP